MKETPFAIVLMAFIAFIGVLSAVVLVEENQTSIVGSIFNQLNQNQTDLTGNQSNLTGNQTMGDQSNLTSNQTNFTGNQSNLTGNQTNQTNNRTIQNINQTNLTFNSKNNITDTRNETPNVSNNYTVKTIVGVETPMRDGVKLIGDLWMPQQDGKYPVIMIRTPYGRGASYMNYTGMGEYFAKQGYVFMVQDVRGKGDSQGNFTFLSQEGQDGYDTIEWAANQSWSNGRIGMMGSSYMGADQYLAAREKPPHLVCIAPTSATGRYMEEIPSIGGAFYMGWALPYTLSNNGRNTDLNALNINWTTVFNHRPLITADEVTGTTVPLYHQFLEHPTMDDYWKQIQFTEKDFNNITIPTLTTCGWFDTDQPGAIFYWNGLKKDSSPRDDQYLIIGPWINSGTFQPAAQLSKIGDLSVPGAQVDVYANHLAFFDVYLKNSSSTNLDNTFNSNLTNLNNANNTFNINLNNSNTINSNASDINSNNSPTTSVLPWVTVYLTGLSKWINLTNYPPQDMIVTPLFLESGGQANTLNGNGFLRWNLTNNSLLNNSSNNLNNFSLNATSDSYTYDPASPRPVAMGSFAVNYNNTENRSDVLVYTTSPLEDPLVILGPVFVELYAASDAKDTDFIARVLDVYPNGTAINLGPEECGGAIRARFRQGFDKEVLLEPGKIEKYRIELFDIGHVFLKGHKIRLEISSSAYPMLHPNPNTGNPIANDTQQQIAHQTIYHDQQYPSAVYLPVIPSNSSLYNQIFS